MTMEVENSRRKSESSLSLEKQSLTTMHVNMPLPSNLDFAMKRSLEMSYSVCNTESVGSIDLSIRSKIKPGKNKADSIVSAPSNVNGSTKQSAVSDRSVNSNEAEKTYPIDDEYLKMDQSVGAKSICSTITGSSSSIRTEKSKSLGQQGSVKSNCAETVKSKHSSTPDSANSLKNTNQRKPSRSGSSKSNCEEAVNCELASIKSSVKEPQSTNDKPPKYSFKASVKSANSMSSNVNGSVRSKFSECTKIEGTVNSGPRSTKSDKSSLKESRSSGTVKSNASNLSKNGNGRSKEMPGSVKCMEEAKFGKVRASSINYSETSNGWDAFDISDVDSASGFNPKSPIVMRRTVESDCASCKSGSTITSNKLGSRSFVKMGSQQVDTISNKSPSIGRFVKMGSQQVDTISNKLPSIGFVKIGSQQAISLPDDASIIKRPIQASMTRNSSLMSTTSSVLSNIETEVEIPHYCPQRSHMPNWGIIPKEQLTNSVYQKCCICSLPFDRFVRVPIRLFCHHNACLKCAMTQMSKSFWEITCGICPKSTELPAAYRMQYLRNNTELMDELEGLLSQNE